MYAYPKTDCPTTTFIFQNSIVIYIHLPSARWPPSRASSQRRLDEQGLPRRTPRFPSRHRGSDTPHWPRISPGRHCCQELGRAEDGLQEKIRREE